MFFPIFIAQAMASAVQEHNDFCDYLSKLPDDERQQAIERRKKEIEAAKAERERREMIEALKPHTLWSFLGIGKK